MKPYVLTAMLLLTQCRGGFCPAPVRAQPPFLPPQVPVHVMTDATGKQWSSTDQEWLKTWVARVNAERESQLRPKAPVPPAAPPIPRPTPGDKFGQLSGGGIQMGVDEKKVFPRRAGFIAKEPGAKAYVAEQAAVDPGETRVHVTVIGSEEQCKPVVADLKGHPAFSPFRDRMDVQDYRPGEWPVDPSLGFGRGEPTVVIQDTVGRALWMAGDYKVGPEGLAKQTEASLLRVRDHDFDPDKVPGPGKFGPLPLGFTSDHLAAVALGVGILALLWYRSRNSGAQP